MANQSKTSPSAGSFGRRLNFHHLYIFQMVASHLSFSRAAEAMQIPSHQCLSRSKNSRNS